MDRHTPFKTVTVCSTDKPWVTPHFKDLVRSRQGAWKAGDQDSYKYLRNKVNKLGAKLRSHYYQHKVNDLKKSDSRSWWRQVKHLCGLDKPSDNLQNMADNICDGDSQALAEEINNFFLSICDDLKPLDTSLIPPQAQVPDEYIIPIETVEKLLAGIKTTKAPGPDGIPSWILHDLPGVLAPPICNIWNSSLREGQLPEMWKCADTLALPKTSPPQDITQDLRPISLTAVLVKLLETVIVPWIREFVITDSTQYGGKGGTNTTHALIDFLHNVHMSADRGHESRALFLDYKKAYDHVDHNIVIKKLIDRGTPAFLVRWVAAFLSGRQQRVKLGEVLSDWGHLKGSVPQGSCIGPLLFVLLIDDLRPQCHHIKFMDDTTLTETIKAQQASQMQNDLDAVLDWSVSNNMVLNAKKTKNMLISFKHRPTMIDTIKLNNASIDTVATFKLLGVHIQDNLKWDHHVSSMHTKTSRQLFFLRQLKKAGLDPSDLKAVYITKIRPCLEYAAPAWATGLTKAHSSLLESIQKRALKIIYPDLQYCDALSVAGLTSLHSRRELICQQLFSKVTQPDHPLHNLLTHNDCSRNLRRKKEFVLPKLKTNRCKQSFINFALYNFQ